VVAAGIVVAADEDSGGPSMRAAPAWKQPAGGSGSGTAAEAYVVRDNLAASAGFQTGAAEIISVRLEVRGDPRASVLKGGEQVRLTVDARAIEEIHKPILGFLVKDRLGQDLFGENTLAAPTSTVITVPAGGHMTGIFEFKLPMLPNGQYAVMSSVASGDLFNHIQHHYLHEALILTVASARVRWGLVGIEFDRVALEASDER
jgi:lipopolysaccharide transport system ATP-binding protein